MACTNLKIISYNCQSLRANVGIVQNLLTECHVLCLQETLIDENNCDILDKLDNNFMNAYVPSVRKDDCSRGRSSGGLIILWSKHINIKFHPVFYNRRVMGVKMQFPNNSTILLLNIYMPYNNKNKTIESLLEYKSILADLSNILRSENFNDVCIAGDFNACPGKGNFSDPLIEFLEENSLCLTDFEKLPSDSYTYISPTSACSCSWLDHFAVSNTNIISGHEIKYGTAVYDHIPISVDILVPQCSYLPSYDSKDNTNFVKIKWDSLTDEDRDVYTSCMDEICLEICHGVLSCNEQNCQREDHKRDLEMIYSDILDGIMIASDFLPSMKGPHKNMVVGWNSYCKSFYDIAREKYLIWHNSGRPRLGSEFDDMKASRTAFKNSLNFCKNNEKNLRYERLLSKFQNSDKSKFWKEISKINGSRSSSSVQVDGETSFKKVVGIFDDKYRRILDDPSCQGGMHANPLPMVGQNASLYPLITLDNICKAIQQLNTGLGWDGIHSNHLKYAGPVFINLLTKFMNKLILHSYVPVLMIHGEIRPVMKCKAFGKNDSSNYRPVLNSSMLLKMLEYCILPFMTKSLNLSNQQFGFRKHTGCLSAITIVKETIFKYNSEATDVHCVKVDLSKAFDRININILFSKLLTSGLDPSIVNLVRAMYDNTFVHTLFNGFKGVPWKVGNGVRQGGILSPLLFCYYIDEALQKITEMKIGCSILGNKTNIIAYADDVFLMAPSASGMQKMLDKLYSLLTDLCMKINTDKDKSNYILFRSKYNRSRKIVPKLFLNGVQLEYLDKCKYLGVILSSDGSFVPDIDRVTSSFFKQFNGMYSKYHFVQRDILYYLFKSYTSSFYGIDVWFDKIPACHLNRVEVAYHKAVKRICGLNVWDSNHVACETVGVNIFKHLLSTRLVSFWHTLCEAESSCLANLKYYFKYRSQIYEKLKTTFLKEYQVDILNNPLCAVKARINYIQRNEPRSYYAQTVDSET